MGTLESITRSTSRSCSLKGNNNTLEVVLQRGRSLAHGPSREAHVHARTNEQSRIRNIEHTLEHDLVSWLIQTYLA